jgi:hypothetical protein
MNTAIDFHRPAADPEHASLGDLLRAVEALRRGSLNAPESEFEGLAMAVVRLAEDLEHMTGYVDGGEVYETAPATAYDRALGDLYEIAQHDIRQGHASPAVTVAVRNVKEAAR